MSDLGWALEELSGNSSRIKRYLDFRRYYLGLHPLAFDGDKYRSTFWRRFKDFADNLCASVVDIQTERLEVVGFTTSNAKHKQEPLPGGGVVTVVDDKLAENLWNAWEKSDLDLVSEKVHKDAFLYGDGFLILEPGIDGAALWPQEPTQMAVAYSLEVPGQMLRAAKTWELPDKNVRVNIYYPDKIEKYVTSNPPPDGTDLTEKMFTSLATDDGIGFIPVFHFANGTYGDYGMSELRDVVPLQDALNKATCDMLVAMEYQAFRQRWITGVDIELDDNGMPKNIPWQHGAGEILSFPDEEVRVGEFGQTDLLPFLNVQSAFRAEIARVSGIPLHYFFVASAGETPSGEALKTAELRFSRKTKKHQRCFGRIWELIQNAVLAAAGEAQPEDINAVWSAESPRSESEEMDVLLKKQAIGVPNSQLQKEAGYDHQQILQFHSEVADGEDTEKEEDEEPAGDGEVPEVQPPPVT